MSYKILYITPHLSTGGCPQYLLKKLNVLKDTHKLYCVEYNNYGEWFIVQKTQVRELLGDCYHVLGDNKHQLLSIIDDIQPDIIHLEEMPEYFMSDDVTAKVYNNERKYHIVETSHDSSFNSANKRFFPDRFVFVSNYQKNALSVLNVPSHVIEYPIYIKDKASNRDEVLRKLGLDPSLLHIVNVGLWSRRKNQGEIIEYANKMLDCPVQFHFVGNTAGNFESYWSPLLKNLPKNCKAWGERNDVDTFYSCMDLFLFTSRGSENDKETSPIVIREAISYKIPSLIYNLPVYLNMYNRYSNISYLSNDLNDNVKKIKSCLNIQNKKRNYAYVVSTYPTTSVEFDTTVQCLNALSDSETILTTHHSDYEKFNTIANSVVYDVSNPIIKHNFYCKYWYRDNVFDFDLNLKKNDNDNYHGLAVWTNYQNGIRKSKELGYKYSVCLNYDIVLSGGDLSVIGTIVNDLEVSKSKGYFIHEVMGEGDTLKTVFFVIDNDYFIEKFERVDTESEYNASLVKYNSPSNGLENYVYNVLKNDLSSLTLTKDKEEKIFPNSSLNAFSRVEYFSVVPNDDLSSFYIWKSSNNVVDNKSVSIRVYEDNKIVLKVAYQQLMNGIFYQPVKYKTGSKYLVMLEEYNSDLKVIDRRNIEFSDINQIRDNGKFTLMPRSAVNASNTINIHHVNPNDILFNDLSELSAHKCVYRNYIQSSEIDVVNNLFNYNNNINVVIKNVQLNVKSEEFVQSVRQAHKYLVDNHESVLGLVIGDTPYIGMSPYYKSSKKNVDVYVINNNHLHQFKTIGSLSDLHSYIKIFTTKSLAK